MKNLILICICFFQGLSITFAQSDLRNAPASLNLQDKRLVFLDFQKSSYDITYDVQKRITYVKSIIDFYMDEDGYPIIDIEPNFLESSIDSIDVKFSKILIPSADTVKFSNKVFRKGYHRLVSTHTFEDMVKYTGTEVSSAFWMSDLKSRKFLERYLPSSFEYDQVKLNIQVSLKNTTTPHTVMTNGYGSEVLPNTWKFTYPEFYTASSLYFHLFPTRSKYMISTEFQSIDGRSIPVIVYKDIHSTRFEMRTKIAVNDSLKYFNELEELFGAWPHDFFIAYVEGSGGMEYSGATMTSSFALRHEMNHSYFARNIVPARGNSGWIDEAIASWADDNYPERLNASPTGVASHSPYRRTTDMKAYGPGSVLLGYLHKNLQTNQKDFKDFLRFYFEKRNRTTVLTHDFQEDIEEFFNVDMNDFFSKYIYRKTTISSENYPFKSFKQVNKYHPQYTDAELFYLL